MSFPAPPALLDKLHTVQTLGLLDPQAKAPPPSPCIAVCRLDHTGQHCVGCLRTLPELQAWGTADAPERRAIWQRIAQRCEGPFN